MCSVLWSGTGGTLAGVARYLKAKNPAVKIVLADPPGSVLHAYVQSKGTLLERTGSSITEGIGQVGDVAANSVVRALSLQSLSSPSPLFSVSRVYVLVASQLCFVGHFRVHFSVVMFYLLSCRSLRSLFNFFVFLVELRAV